MDNKIITKDFNKEEMNSNTIQKEGWNFDNSYVYLPKTFYSKQKPTPVKAPELVILNDSVAEALGLNVSELREQSSVEVFGGNQVADGAQPIAQAYAGHQFGYFTMLGDGRAILIGEQITPKGERCDIQLKGPGETPYSRRGDGRATLGPMLREYIISEAMNALGIPTTRSLAVVTTGEKVIRESALPGAILTRVASSHIRVGTFQYAAKWGTLDEVRSLADYAIDRHYKEAKADENPYLSFLNKVIERQASLIAKWMLVGFVHGVMNTDNMTISGESIDYGPCAFIDTFEKAAVFSSIDTHGRYAYSNQPIIALWNLTRFAETILPLLSDDETEAVDLGNSALSKFNAKYQEVYVEGMRAKLGLFNQEPEDEALINELLNSMESAKADYTNTFYNLTLDKPADMIIKDSEEFVMWHALWQDRLSRQEESKEATIQRMRENNPVVIPRNHRVEEALEAAVNQGDYSVLNRLLEAITNPFEYTKNQEEYTKVPENSGKCYKTYCGT